MAPRLIALCLWPSPAHTNYWELSQALLRDGMFGFDGYPTTYLEPLYPAVLAGLRVVTGDHPVLVLLLQIALASSAGVLLFLVAERIAGRRVAWLAAACYACYPYLVRQSVAYLAMNLTLPLVLAVALRLMTATRLRAAVACGALFGLLVLARASFELALVAAAAWTAWRRGPMLGAVLLATALAVQAPWMARNARLDVSPLPSRLGENLLVSTSRYAELVIPRYDVDALVPLIYDEVRASLPPELRDSPHELERAMLARVLRFVREHPLRAARLKARNVLSVFDPRLLPRHPAGPGARAIPQGRSLQFEGLRSRPLIEEIAHAVARACLLTLAIAALWRRRPSIDEEAVLLLVAANVAVCVMFFPTTRLLVPTTTLLMVYAGAGGLMFWQRLSRRS